MSAASKTFDRILRSVAQDPLRAQGFAFDGSRTFRRAGDGGIQHIVNFQLGQRSLEGKFAVNLAVYVPADAEAQSSQVDPAKVMEFHCAPVRRERLGRLMPRRLRALENVPVLGLFCGLKDVWWRFSEDAEATGKSVAVALAAIEAYGLAWLAGATPRG